MHCQNNIKRECESVQETGRVRVRERQGGREERVEGDEGGE